MMYVYIKRERGIGHERKERPNKLKWSLTDVVKKTFTDSGDISCAVILP